MRRFVIAMWLGFERRPTRDEQAFLGEVGARVQPTGIADLMVYLDLEAPDMGAALSSAQDLIVDKLGADLLHASVAVHGFEVRPGSWWQRRRRRNRAPADARSPETGDDQPERLVIEVVGTGVDPVTFRFSGGRSAN